MIVVIYRSPAPSVSAVDIRTKHPRLAGTPISVSEQRPFAVLLVSPVARLALLLQSTLPLLLAWPTKAAQLLASEPSCSSPGAASFAALHKPPSLAVICQPYYHYIIGLDVGQTKRRPTTYLQRSPITQAEPALARLTPSASEELDGAGSGIGRHAGLSPFGGCAPWRGFETPRVAAEDGEVVHCGDEFQGWSAVNRGVWITE